MKFMNGLRRGVYKPKDVDRFIGEWHRADTSTSLPSYLGMSFQEYTAWVEGKLELHDVVGRASLPPTAPAPGFLTRVIAWLLARMCGLPR